PGALIPPDTAAIQRDLDANPPVPVVPEHAGDATVVAYSVVHGRDGLPESALLVCDVGGGARTYARLADADACRAAEEQELVGRTVGLAPHTVTGPAGETRVNAANVT